MRRLLPVMLLASGCHLALDPEVIPAPLVRVDIHYSGFRPGCVQLVARHPSNGGLESATMEVPPGSREGRVVVVIYDWDTSRDWAMSQPDVAGVIVADESWGNHILVTVAAREQSCQGRVVASNEVDVAILQDAMTSVSFQLIAADADLDGYVRAPAGTDCDDMDVSVRPRDGGEPLCDGKDDDCSGGADDTFMVGAACTPTGGCGGAIACAPGTPSQSTICAPLPTRQYFVDGDGDSFGGLDAGFTCRPDAGMVLVPGDCDDTRQYVYPGADEVCDRLDDNCNGVTDDIPGQRCDRILVPGLINSPSTPGPRLAMAGVGRVVVAGGDGGVAYVESDGGVLWRGGVCSGDWYGAWVHPANDRVFLGGASGALAALDRMGGCLSQPLIGSFHFGLWAQADGGPSPLINFIDSGGHYGTWVFPSAPVDHGVQVTPCCGNLRGLDGRPNGVMMTAGWQYDGIQRHARVMRSPGPGLAFVDLRVEDALVDAGLGTMQAALHDVTFPRDDLAYAAGEGSLLVRWNGTAWTVLPPFSPLLRPSINSVVAFDEQNVYLATGGFILRWDGSGYRTVVFAESTSFSQVRGSSPDDLWAVANGQVWHFSAGP